MSIKGRIQRLERDHMPGPVFIMPVALDDQGQRFEFRSLGPALAAIRYTDGQENFEVSRLAEEDAAEFEARAAAQAKAHFNATLVGALDDEGI